MRILVTNDDGIHADGLAVCEAIAQSIGAEVWTVAPESDQSGVAHSLSLNDPLRLREAGPQRFAVLGTPTDCVIMALKHIMPSPPDLILSGVNRGQNVAEDVTYSGTVAAAMEGTILGVPSIALSQAYGPGGREYIAWDCARQHAPALIKKVLEIGIDAGTLVNINFPNCQPAEVVGTRVTTQGQRDANFLRIEARNDGRMIPYYWIGFTRGQYDLGHGTDLEALAQKHISLTPLRLNLTDEPNVTRFASHF